MRQSMTLSRGTYSRYFWDIKHRNGTTDICNAVSAVRGGDSSLRLSDFVDNEPKGSHPPYTTKRKSCDFLFAVRGGFENENQCATESIE